MRWFIIRVLSLWVGLATLIGAFVFIRHQQADDAPLQILHLTDCAPPCWIGITPGKTTIDEARQRIEAVYGQLPDYRLILDPTAPPNLLQGSLTRVAPPKGRMWVTLHAAPDNVIDTITLDGLDMGPRGRYDVLGLAELYRLFGPPSGVYLNGRDLHRRYGLSADNGIASFAFIYGDTANGLLVFATQPYNAGRLSWEAHSTALIFYGGKGLPGLWLPPQSQTWHGFRTLTGYATP